MVEKQKVLFPVRLNSRSPIQTIHRKIARYLQNRFSFVALSGDMRDRDKNIDAKTIDTRSRWANYKKGLQLLRLYYPQYDLIHTGASSIKNHQFLVRLASLRGAKHIHTHHTAVPGNYHQQQWLANHADTVTANSPFVAKWAENNFGISNVVVIPNGVDMAVFEPVASPAEQTFVFVGRLVEQKHPEQVIRLARERPDATFKICGLGPLQREIVDKAQSLENVILVSKLDHDELADLYADATAVLCPYEQEGFGMVVIESMSSGTPVIGLDSGNLSSLIETGRNGILCDSLNLDEWLAALKYIQTKRERFEPRESVKQYSWDAIAASYGALYSEVLT